MESWQVDRDQKLAQGVIFYDAKGSKHTAFLRNAWRSEIIVAAGATGSPQLLMLSGIGPASQLEQLGIQGVLNQPMVGKDVADIIHQVVS